MQEVPFGIFRSFAGIQQTLNSMISTKYDNFKHSYHIKRLGDEIQKRHKDFLAMHSEIMEDAEWEDDTKKVLKNKPDIDKKFDELFETTFECKWAPLPVAIVEKINPTPEQFHVIEPLMNPEDLDDK